MSIKERRDKDDIKLSLFIVCYYFFSACNEFIVLVLGGNQVLSILSKLLLLFPLCAIVLPLWKRMGSICIIAEVSLMCMYLGSYFIYGNVERELLLSVMFRSVFIYLPLGMCAYCIFNKEILFRHLYIWSWPTQMILVIVLIYIGRMNQETYSMSAGYALLLPVLVISGHWLKTKKVCDVFVVGLDLLIIALFGSRGPLMCFAAFVLMNIVLSNILHQREKVFYVTFLIVIILFIIFNFHFIVSFIAETLDKFGYSSRTLRLLLQGLGTYDSGRGFLKEQYIHLIFEKPWLGWGAVGGRKFGAYPHNIYLELLLCFGIPFGLFLSITITMIFIRGVLQKDSISQLLAIIFVSKVLCLTISDSLFQCSEFFVCIALCLCGRVYLFRSYRGLKLKRYRKGVKEYQ